MNTRSTEYVGELHSFIVQHFSLEEIHTLCFKLNVDYESVPGEEKSARTRELLLALARNGRLSELLALAKKERPQVDWQPVPDDFQLPVSLSSESQPLPVQQNIISGDMVEGDQIGRDKITTGNIEGSYNVIGSGQINVNITNNEAPAIPEKPKLPIEPALVRIPAGPFIMGSDAHDHEEMPQHIVDLSEFHISIYPITNEEFAQFIWKTGRVAGSTLLWNGNMPPNELLNHPVAGVTWYEALAYCQWLSELSGRHYTLPTEAQWEKAARCENGRLYPWGNEWELNRCNTNLDQTTSAQAYPAQNEAGCFDMVGNVREWTATIWGVDPRNPDPMLAYPWQDDRRNDLDEPSTSRRIFRGGRAKEPVDFRCSSRNSYLPEKAGPKRNRHGFRVILLPAS